MMKNQLPKTIDPIKLADQETHLQGHLEVASFSRLNDIMFDKEGTVQLDLRLGRDMERFYYIQGRVEANLHLQCQRCMQKMNFPIDIMVSLSPVSTLEAAKNLPDRYEPLLVEEEKIELLSIIEDELLISLPMVPKHESENCTKMI